MNKQIILELSQKVKRLNIITNHIEEFQDIEDYLYNEMGIMIKLSNNKKTDLLKTNIIINMDFMEDIINKYNLPKQGIIININVAKLYNFLLLLNKNTFYFFNGEIFLIKLYKRKK